MLLFHLNIVLFPVVFVFLVVSSAASAPLLALFSLPIFLLTYPRPSRFWPTSSGKSFFHFYYKKYTINKIDL